MKRSSTETHKIANSKALHTVVFAIAMISFTSLIVLTAKAHHDEDMRYEIQAEVKRLRKVHKECSVAWPYFGKHYDECLKRGQVKS